MGLTAASARSGHSFCDFFACAVAIGIPLGPTLPRVAELNRLFPIEVVGYFLQTIQTPLNKSFIHEE